MSFKIKRESKILKSLIIGLALLLIGWGGVELTLRPGLGHTTSDDPSDRDYNTWYLDGMEDLGSGWIQAPTEAANPSSDGHKYSHVADNQRRIKEESPYLMVGTDGKGGDSYGGFDNNSTLELSLWVPSDSTSVRINAYELCHNWWDGHVGGSERTVVYIRGASGNITPSSGRNPIEGERGSRPSANTSVYCDVNQLQWVTFNPQHSDNTPIIADKELTINNNPPKNYHKYNVIVEAQNTSGSYYSLFKLKTQGDDALLTHNGQFGMDLKLPDNPTNTDYKEWLAKYIHQSDKTGIALSHAYPGTFPDIPQTKGPTQTWQASFITATNPSEHPTGGSLGLVGIYDNDCDYTNRRPDNVQQMGSSGRTIECPQIGGSIEPSKVTIESKDRHSVDGWSNAVTYNFNGRLVDSDKMSDGHLPIFRLNEDDRKNNRNTIGVDGHNGPLFNGIKAVLRGEDTNQLNGQKIMSGYDAELFKNNWEELLFYFDNSKIYKITFHDITSNNYVQFKVPFEYGNTFDEQDPDGIIKIAKTSDDKCYLYIHYLKHVTTERSEKRNEIQLKFQNKDSVLEYINGVNVKNYWVDQKDNLDEDPFIYDDHKGSALKPYKPAHRSQDLNGRRVIAQVTGDLGDLSDENLLKITAKKHRPLNNSGNGSDYPADTNINIEFKPLKDYKEGDCGIGEIDIDLNTCRVFFRYLNINTGDTATVFVYKPGTKTVLVDNGANKIMYEDTSEKGFYNGNTFESLKESKIAHDNRTIFALTNPPLPSNKVNISLAQPKWLHDYEFEITIPDQSESIEIPTTEGFAKKLERIREKKHKCDTQPTLYFDYDLATCRLFIKTLNLTINKRQPDIQVQFYRNNSLLGPVHYIDNTSRPLPHKTYTQYGQAVNRYSQNLLDPPSIPIENLNTLMLLTKETVPPRTEDTKPAKIRWFNMIADQSLEVRVYKYHDGSAWKDLSTVLPSGVDYLNIDYHPYFPDASAVQTSRTTNCSPTPPDPEQCETNAGTDLSKYIKRSYNHAYPSLESISTYDDSPSYTIKEFPDRPSSGHHDWGAHFCDRMYRCPSGYYMDGILCKKTVDDSTRYSPSGRGEDAYCRGGERDEIHNWRGHVIDCERTRSRTVTTPRIYVGCNMIHRTSPLIHDEPGPYRTLYYNLGSNRTGEVNIQWSQFKDLDDTLLEQILRLNNHGDNWQSLDSQALISLRNNRSNETSYAGKLNILNANVDKGLNLVAANGLFSKFDFSSLPVSKTATKTMRGATTGDMSAVLKITVKQVSRLGGGSLSSSPSLISSGGTLTAADPSASNPGIHIYKWVLEWELLITETFAWQWQTYNPVSRPDIHTTSQPNLNSWSTRNASAQRTVQYSGNWSVCSRSLVVDPPTCQVITKNNAAIDYEQEEFDANAVGGSNTNNHFVYPVGINNAFTKFQVINPNKIGLNAGASYSINGTTGAYAPGPANDISRRSVAQQLVAHVKSSSNNVELHQNAHTMNLPGKYGIHWQPSWTVERSSQDWGSNTADWDGAIPPPSTVCSNDPSTPPNTYTSWFYIYADPPTCRVEYTVFEVDDSQTRVTVTLNNPNAVPMTIDRLEYSINRPGSGSNNENSVNVLNKNGNGHTIAANKKTILKSNRKPRNITGQFDFEWTIRTKIGNEYWLTDNDDTGQDSWFEDIDERITFAGGDCQQTLRIVRRPYLKTFYGGLIVGGTYGAKHTSDSCSAAGKINNPNADDFVYAHSTTDASTPKGSSAQFHVQVYDQIAGFYSANLRNNPPKPFKGLTIGQQGDFGGNFNQKQCLANLWQRIDGISVQTVDNLNLNSLDPKNNDDDKRVYIKPDSGTLILSSGGNNLGTLRTTLYVDGDIIINENIINNDDPKWTDYKDIGYITIIAKGNIYIHPTVSRIDAFLVAYPLTNSQGNYESKGEVFTCKEGPSSNFDATNHFNSLCNNPLTINGAIYAQKLRPGRIFKSVLQAADHPADNPTNSKASEMILLLPEYIIGIPELPNFTDEDFLVDAIFVGAPPF